MVTKWKCELSFLSAPEPVDVIAETDCFITVREKVFTWDESEEFRERRMKKENVFNTFHEAKAAMVERAKENVVRKESEWQRAKNDLQNCNNLKTPNVKLRGAALLRRPA